MDISKLAETFGKSSLVTDSFEYLARMILGLLLLVELSIFLKIDYLAKLSLIDIHILPTYLVIIGIMLLLMLCVFIGTIHITILEGIVMIIAVGLIFSQSIIDTALRKSKLSIELFSYKLTNTHLLLWNDKLFTFLRYPFVYFYGIPALTSRDNIFSQNVEEQELINKIRKYFDLKEWNYLLLESLASSLVNCEHVSTTKPHIDQFYLSLVKGAVVLIIYFLLFNYHNISTNVFFIGILFILILQIRIRQKLESINSSKITDAYIIINKHNKVVTTNLS